MSMNCFNLFNAIACREKLMFDKPNGEDMYANCLIRYYQFK